MAALRVLAVDDEEHALADLTWLLSQATDVEEVLTANSGADALRQLNDRTDIDAVFMDIQMPGLDGVELVKVLKNFKTPPAIAFVTAFEDYAVDAFELDVCDYLLKPVDQRRLDETVRRIRALSAANDDPAAGDGPMSRLVYRVGNQTVTIERKSVSIIEAAGDYVRVHTDDNAYLIRETISSLTSAWAPHGFVRIHRSYLVRVDAIREVRTLDGKRTVTIADHELPVSRRYSRLLQSHLGGSI